MLQTDLALELGISVAFLSELENGRRGTRRIAVMEKIRAIVGIPLDAWLAIPRSVRSANASTLAKKRKR